MDCDDDGLEANPEYGEIGGGVGVGVGPLAVLFCVSDERSAGPGMSAIKLVRCSIVQEVDHSHD